jgi:trafficking protein particle complex subunit 1
VYSKLWISAPPPVSSSEGGGAPGTAPQPPAAVAAPTANSIKRAGDDAKLIFGTVFSLRNMARKLGGDDDAFISYRTAQYKLHYYETPTNLRFALLTEPGAPSMRNVLHQIYINLWVEYGKFNRRVGCNHPRKGDVQLDRNQVSTTAELM